MKRILVLAAAVAVVTFGASAGNAAECVRGYLNVPGNPNIPCTVDGTGSAAVNPDFSAGSGGTAIDDTGPATTGSVQPARPAVSREPTSLEDCQPGGYWLKQDPAESYISTLMMCPN
jgi:hypothetical protein